MREKTTTGIKNDSVFWQLFFIFTFLLCASIATSLSAKAAAPTDVYRFWSSTNNSHFYTASAEERDLMIATYAQADWKYEGAAFQVYAAQETGTVPIYRFWSNTNRSHFYTASGGERDLIIASYPENVWKYEGVAWYAYDTAQAGTTPVYRFWSDQNSSHFYTLSPGEKNCIMNSYAETEWRYENTGYWVPGVEPSNTENASCGASYGPEIKVGVWSYSRDDIRSSGTPVQINATRDYLIKNSNGTGIAAISASVATKVKYTSDGNLSVYGDSLPETVAGSEVSFEAADGNNSNMVFGTNKSGSYKKYRGKMKLKYSDTTNNLDLTGDSKRIWLVNTLPLELYVWGMGEIKGTGAMEYNKVMTTSFRTYGYFWIYESTKYIPEGFTVNATPGNQLYYGYDYELSYPRIKEAALMTRGHVMVHPQSTFTGNIAITPYSSWTDGRTRSFEERWGSTFYPWCQSVADPYGKHPSMSTSELVAAGNHMVGLSANGALKLATDHAWIWTNIIKYYYTGVDIYKSY